MLSASLLGARLLSGGLQGTALAAAPYVVVLGVAQDAGHPQIGCSRTCCAAAWSDGGHRVSSLGLVDPDTGQHWLLDATPDLPAQDHDLPGTLAGIVLTHAHIGHYTGLMYLGREAMGAKDVPVWAMPRMGSFLRSSGPWSQLVDLKNIVIQDIVAGQPVQISPSLRVTPLLVPHRDEFSETVGLVVEGPSRRVLYLPDIDKWSRWSTAIEDVVRTVDVAFLDGTFYDGTELPGRDMAEVPHPFMVETMARFKALPASERAKVQFIHLNHTNPALVEDSAAATAVKVAGLGLAIEGAEHPL